MSPLRRITVLAACLLGLTALTIAPSAAAAPAGRGAAAPAAARRAVVDSALTDVSCPTAHYCSAVGYRNGVPIAKVWDGRAWAAAATPKRNGALSSVWCVGKAQCFAVGHHTSGGVTHALAEVWNGTEWDAVAAPDDPNGTSTSLEAVTCRTARDCMATGSWGQTGSPRHTLAEHWNGWTWTIVTTPDPPLRVSGNDLPAVACTLSTRCVATGVRGRGSFGSHAFALTWTGASWQRATAPTPGGSSANSTLTGVSCSATTTDLCMSVGMVAVHGVARPLAEKWTGGAWHQGHPRHRAAGDQLNDVACVSHSRCLAIGNSASGRTLAETWNEHGWKIDDSGGPAGRFDDLQSISCGAVEHCLAVGFSEQTSSGAVHPLTEQWTGSAWRVVSS